MTGLESATPITFPVPFVDFPSVLVSLRVDRQRVREVCGPPESTRCTRFKSGGGATTAMRSKWGAHERARRQMPAAVCPAVALLLIASGLWTRRRDCPECKQSTGKENLWWRPAGFRRRKTGV